MIKSVPMSERFHANSYPRTQTEDIGGVRLSYLAYEGQGPPLVFMHATGFLPWLWHPVARGLSSFFRIIAPHFCDHRESDPDQGGLSWMLLAEDTASLCNRLDIKSAFLVGHSMGATVLTFAAALYGLQPLGMVLIEPIFLPGEFYRRQITVEQHPLASKSIKRRNSWDSRDEARDYLLSKQVFRTWDPEMIDLYIEHGMKMSEAGALELACSPRKEAALFMGARHYDPWPLLSDISCPVLIVEGQLSDNRQFIDLKAAASRFPRGSYRLVENTGHLIPMERPAETIAMISDFFKPLL
jgi:lipase